MAASLRVIYWLLLSEYASATCPLTPNEKLIAGEVEKRKKYLSSGAIKSAACDPNHPSIDSTSIKTSLSDLWVQYSLIEHTSAIDKFVSIMKQAKQKAQKDDFLAVLFGWFDLLLGPLEDAVAAIKEPVQALTNGVKLWKANAKESDGDFLAVADKFRAHMNKVTASKLVMIEDFGESLALITPFEKRCNAIVDAYELVTNMIANTVSERKAFNQYYLRFLKGANLGNDPTLYYAIGGDSGGEPTGPFGGRYLWFTSPSGLDACTIANSVYDINLGCVAKPTPGMEKINYAVQIMIGFPGDGFHLNCANLDPTAYIGCWNQKNYFAPKSNSKCSYEMEVAKYKHALPSNGWPSKEVLNFCKHGLYGKYGAKTHYSACHYGGRNGPANCMEDHQSYPFFLPCRRSASASNQSTVAIVV